MMSAPLLVPRELYAPAATERPTNTAARYQVLVTISEIVRP